MTADPTSVSHRGDPVGAFTNLDDYNALPRIDGLVLSPDGTRLVCSVQTLSPDRATFQTSLWDVDPDGVKPARRLTRSAAGESAPAFGAGGDLLFISKRPAADKGSKATGDVADAADASSQVAAVWCLPVAGGEPRALVSAPGGLTGVYVARDAGTVVVTGSVLPGAADTDAARRAARKKAGVSALLHESTPVRHWDHDLGPDQVRLFVVEQGLGVAADTRDGVDADAEAATLRDLAPSAGRALDEPSIAISCDGAVVVAAWHEVHARGRESRSLVAIDTATGNQRVLAGALPTSTDAGTDHGAGDTCSHWYDHPAISPDGRLIVCVDETEATYERAPQLTLWLIDTASGAGRDLLPGFLLWPASPVFSADSSAVFFTADDNGRRPIFRVDVASGTVVKLTAAGAYSSVNVAPAGRDLFALRADVDRPMTPVRLNADIADQEPVVLRGPGRPLHLPGHVEEVETVAPGGARVRAWLVLPDSATANHPAPLALWVHGGPLASWDAWSWRWNPWLLAARGWAVLLPDPALSQGYGDDFIQRGWGNWGPVPFADLMAITDATINRDDIDATRTAAMGGSYGGYMANWIAGHTNRFKAIVTHASLWTTDHFTGATDHPWAWEQEWGHPLERPERFERNSPHLHIAAIRTPMLVIHGDRDYRVPIGEGLRLFADLVRYGVDVKFLYFPDENHWVLKPGNAKVWYQTVFAFLDHHVLDAPWIRPDLV
jgi:dipeptidyl aminopeptidase/acylaminoacyl peptidase